MRVIRIGTKTRVLLTTELLLLAKQPFCVQLVGLSRDVHTEHGTSGFLRLLPHALTKSWVDVAAY